MAHENKVYRSINQTGGNICVDIFQRPDGSFGFDEFRRDGEDGRGWFVIGHYGAAKYETATIAFEAALKTVSWLADEI